MLTQLEWEQINDITATIHSIKNSVHMRTAFLQKLMKLIDFSLSDFSLGLLKNSSNPCLVDPVVVSKFDKTFEENFTYQYESIFAPMDYVKWVFLSSDSLAYRESDLVNDEVRKKSPFYRDYLKIFDLTNIAGIVISSGGAFVGAVTLYKSEKSGDFSSRDLYILKQILPHLQTRFELDAQILKQNEKSISYQLKNQFFLTNREVEILGLIYQGNSNSEIADKLEISLNTVKKHASNIFDKTEVSSRTMLIQFIMKHNLSGLWE